LVVIEKLTFYLFAKRLFYLGKTLCNQARAWFENLFFAFVEIAFIALNQIQIFSS